jgi:tetratricopeptide (TPR) repeat protein
MGSAIKSSGGYDEWYAPTITYFSGEHHTDELDKKPLSPCKAGKPYTIRVQVTARQIQVLYNRQNQLQAKKKSAGFGQISFRAAPSDFDELVIEGRVEPSWLQRLEDASTQSQRAAFEKSFDLREHLPAWLLDATAAAGSVAKGQKAGAGEAAKEGGEGDEARASSLVFPETLDQDAWKVVQRAFKIADSAKAIEFLRRQPEDALSPETRSYVLAFLHWQADQLAEAIVEADRACGARPDAAGSRWLRARILAEAGGRARALEDYQWVLQTELGRNPLVHVELVELLLRMGRFADAQRAMDKVQELGLTHEHLARTRQRLQKAMQGPTWARRFASASANYVVASDISEALCVQAAKVLEEGLALFETDLEQLPAATEKQQFRTFLFGGEVGYQAYCKDLGDDAPRHTAGLYYPGIKQLLIWNVPRREDMLRTVRHEGFHQYLDRLMADPPRWFNEGLAEYFEGVVQKGGRWNVGAVRRDHLDTLKANGPLRLPLAEFVQQGAAQFMANAPINYAQSWAFVHFLRHGPEQHRPLFQALWRALREGQTASQAMATVLPPGVLAGLQLEFDRYLWEAK